MQRIGVDLGGTKIEAALVDESCRVLDRIRCATPAEDYQGTIRAIVELTGELERRHGLSDCATGICTPGAVSPVSGLMKNANSTCLNKRPLYLDLEAALGRDIRIANDADCLAASELNGGALQGCESGFAVIVGTGVGGGVVTGGALLQGENAIAGEWGHNSLPWPMADEVPGPACWCGKTGCIEAWLSGPALLEQYRALGAADEQGLPGAESAADVAVLALHNDTSATAALHSYTQRLSRALASVINLLDPQCIVVGGGLSHIQGLYTSVPTLWSDWVFSDAVTTRIEQAHFGDSSGVRGAAALWPVQHG